MACWYLFNWLKRGGDRRLQQVQLGWGATEPPAGWSSQQSDVLKLKELLNAGLSVVKSKYPGIRSQPNGQVFITNLVQRRTWNQNINSGVEIILTGCNHRVNGNEDNSGIQQQQYLLALLTLEALRNWTWPSLQNPTVAEKIVLSKRWCHQDIMRYTHSQISQVCLCGHTYIHVFILTIQIHSVNRTLRTPFLRHCHSCPHLAQSLYWHCSCSHVLLMTLKNPKFWPTHFGGF